MNPVRTFEAEGKTYEIRYSMKRIEQYEASHRPIMSSFIQNGGAFSIAELKGLIAYGLKVEDGGYVSPNQGMAMATNIIEQNGYVEALSAVAEALERDCGFFFSQGATVG